MGNYTIFVGFENHRRGGQARNLTTNAPKILDLKSSSEQIFYENCRWVPLTTEALSGMVFASAQKLSIALSFLLPWQLKLSVFVDHKPEINHSGLSTRQGYVATWISTKIHTYKRSSTKLPQYTFVKKETKTSDLLRIKLRNLNKHNQPFE